MHAAAPLLDSPPLVRFGLPELVKGANPAAAADFSETIPGDFYQRLLAVSVRLTPDANVAARTLYIECLDPESVRTAIFGAPVTVPASDTTDFFFSAWLGQPDWEVASTVLVPIAPLLLPPTHSWRITVNGVQAGDTLTRIRYWRERFYTTGQPPSPDAGY